MASRHVDATRFIGIGAFVDWSAIASGEQKAGAKVEPADHIAERRKLDGVGSLQLRWAFAAGLGYPRTPFTVWTRTPNQDIPEVGWTETFGISGSTVLLDGAYAEVLIDLKDGPGGLATGYQGMPFASVVQALVPVTSGSTTVRLTGPEIRVVVLPWGSQISLVRARPDVADEDTWEELEIVGLPGDGRTAHATDLTADQGMVSALTDPMSAAHDRFRRGAPFYGWPGLISSGVPAPGWQLADPGAMIHLFQGEMLDDFITMVDSGPSDQQEGLLFHRTIATPTGSPATVEFNPLRMLLYGAATDPLDALVTGFGTAYPTGRRGGGRLATAMVGGGGPVDFMVTATFVGPLGNDKEWAALILGVGPQLPPVAPSDLGAQVQGLSAPVELDDPFSPVVSIGWDAPPGLLPFHLGSYATARRGLTPGSSVVSLLQARPGDTALQPIGGSVNPATPHRRSASDTSALIDSAWTPNRYAWSVAAQSVFGVWSRWSETTADAQEPPVGKVDLAACRLDSAVGSGGVSTSLTCDVSWNWSSRRPLQLELVGRRYPQTWPDDPPPSGAPTSADTFAGAGSGLLARLSFGPDGSVSAAGGAGLTATVRHLSMDGKTIEAAPVQARGPRRYRVVVHGLPLDFNAAGRWGVALWGRGQERRTPQRMGGWNLQPVVVSAADPRPPVVPIAHEDVLLASVRGPDGLHRADLRWAPIPGAVGYRVYTCSEATFRGMFGLAEPAPSDTLSDRLAELRAAFRSAPDRRPFTRLSSDQVSGTSLPITLPRGTKDIHLFMVLGVSAGQVESVWPDPADAQSHRKFVAFAAPQVVVPPAPQIEIGLDDADPTAFATSVRIAAPPGALVRRIDLHRVRVPAAADTLDTMGPPIATISASGGTYTVTRTPTTPSGQSGLDTVRGTDPVPGSWKPVYYRAVAWAHDDPTKGQYAGRSLPSVIRQVLVPPATGPTLSGPSFVLPVAGSAHALISTTITAPLEATPLGEHVLEAEVITVAPDGTTGHLDLVRPADPVTATAVPPGPVAVWPLSTLPDSEPGTPGSGLWHEPTTSSGTVVRLTVRRSDPDLALRVRLRITDPLGRINEKLLDVPPGAAAALTPDITNPVVSAVPGGWLLTFTTGAPNTGPGGPFVLDVTFRPTGSRRRTQVALELARLPWLPRTGNLLTDPRGAAYRIPLMRSRRTGGVTTIGVGFRAAGSAVVKLIAPDGTDTSITREIGS